MDFFFLVKKAEVGGSGHRVALEVVGDAGACSSCCLPGAVRPQDSDRGAKACLPLTFRETFEKYHPALLASHCPKLSHIVQSSRRKG